ncbi:MAG: C4-dicarboxylate transporter substrate-binding protein [Sedimentibacter sp.]|nr:C4-dicarboxylate transporter substrate-binding protein [Sedimentibacter sp.]
MSKIVYDKMPADIQQALREAGKEAGEFERQRSEALEKEYLEQIKETGMVITNPDIAAFQEAVKPVLEKYQDVYGDSLAKILGQ